MFSSFNVKSCYKINKIEQCKDVKRKINYVSEIYPSEDIRSTYDIDFERYYKEGYRGVIFDVDNTLVPHNAPADERAKKLFKRLDAMGMQYCFTSNNKEPRVKAFCEAVGGKYYVYKANKPSIKGYETAMKLMGTDKKEYILRWRSVVYRRLWSEQKTGIHSILCNTDESKEEIQIVASVILKRLCCGSTVRKH